MALTAAERQAVYRERHPEKIAAYKASLAKRISDAKYRRVHGPHPMNIKGTEAFIRYRQSEKYLHTQMRAFLRRYGMSVDQYLEKLAQQNGVCKICGLVDDRTTKGRRQILPLCVDHCHETGRVRGLLCNKCNVAIALLKEKVSNLENAIRYLREA